MSFRISRSELEKDASDRMAAFFGLRDKIAKARWQLEEPGLSPDQVRARRAEYYQHAPQLSPEQLERLHTLRAKQVQNMRSQGLISHDPTPHSPLGARFTGKDVIVPENTGQMLRGIASPAQVRPFKDQWFEKFLPERVRTLSMPEMPAAAPVDAALTHAAAKHELGEKAQYGASRAGDISARALASHIGETPNLAERIPLFQHPEANEIFDKLRASNPDDAFTQKMMKRFGHTPGAPIPLGGRQHRALAEAALKYYPKEYGAKQFRNTGKFPAWHEAMEKALKGKLPPGMEIMKPAPTTYSSPGAASAARKVQSAMQSLEQHAPSSPVIQKIVEKLSPIAQQITHPLSVPKGDAAAFLKRLSSV
jgi:hypothetical protein